MIETLDPPAPLLLLLLPVVPLELDPDDVAELVGDPPAVIALAIPAVVTPPTPVAVPVLAPELDVDVVAVEFGVAPATSALGSPAVVVPPPPLVDVPLMAAALDCP